MSGLVKGIKKIFKKIPILKAIVVAAAVWFTAGTAAAYFAAPEAGLGAAMSSSASTMWSTTTQALGMKSATAAQSGGGVAQASQTVMGGPAMDGVVTGTGMGPGAAPLQAGFEGGLVGPTAEAALPAVAPGAMPGMEAAAATLEAATPQATGMLSWLKANPMATMMLGQGAAGAYSGYLNDKEAEREQDRWDDRGTMGYDNKGNYQGVVNSSMPAEQAVAEPINATERPVVRSQLPYLRQQGQIRNG